MMTPGGLHTDVALKVLRVDIDTGGEAVRRLRDEGRMLSSVRHPAILRVHDLALLEGRVALVTEYVAGQDLAEVIAVENRLPPRALVQVIGVVADALEAAWTHQSEDGRAMRLIHRDIKPSNIRLGRHGEVKLLDFGIARSDEVDREARTGTGSTVGSIAYMAPERYSRTPAARPADIYALGCCLYEGLCGRRLFVDAVPVEMFRLASDATLHRAHVDEALAELPDHTSDEVRALLFDLLRHDRAARPDAATTVARCEALVEKLDGSALRRWARQREWPPVGLVRGNFNGRTITEGTLRTSGLHDAFPPDALSADATYLVDLDNKTATDSLVSREPPAPESSRRRPVVLGVALAVVALLALGGYLAAPTGQEGVVGTPTDVMRPVVPPVAPVSAPTPVPALGVVAEDNASPGGGEAVEGPVPSEPDQLEPAPVVAPAPAVAPATTPVTEPVAAPPPGPVASAAPATGEGTDDETEVPEPVPMPPPVVEIPGTVVIKGSAERVLLSAGGERLPPGHVPPGNYDVLVAFEPGAEVVKVNVIRVLPGQKVTLTCNVFTYTCE